MSGHSKWSTIKHRKGAADARRGQLFSKLARAIIVAAREGGPDPEANFALANAIQKARDSSLPKENIERAIARGAGGALEGSAYEQITYEGYGAGGIAILVETLSDNRNRTASELRRLFSKHDGNLGTSGSVAWLFERRGVVLVSAGSTDEESLVLAAADGGAEDVTLDGSTFQVTCATEDLQAVRTAIEAVGIPIDSAAPTMLPKSSVRVEDETTARKLLRLLDALEENEDVQDVYANFDIAELLMEAVGA